MTVSSAQLLAAMTALETAAGGTTVGNDNESGRWKRVAAASETLAGAGTSANVGISGYMLRTAVALESIAETSGAEENRNYSGLLKRIVDALEALGVVGTGSLGHRLVLAAEGADFSTDSPATFGSEMVTNNSFATDSDFTKTGSAPTISGGAAHGDGIGLCEFQQTLATMAINKVYRWEVVVSALTVGIVNIFIGASKITNDIATPGTYSGYFTVPVATGVFILQIDSDIGAVDSVSIKEMTSIGSAVELVTLGDFSAATGWAIAGTGAAITGGQFAVTAAAGVRTASRTANETLALNDWIVATITLSGRTAGTGSVSAAGVISSTRSVDGAYAFVFQLTSVSNQDVAARVSIGGQMNLDDISMKKLVYP